MLIEAIFSKVVLEWGGSVSAVLLGNRILSYKPVEASCVAELQET